MKTLLTDAIDHLRRHYTVHLGQPGNRCVRIASLVVQDALALGVTGLSVKWVEEGWIVVSASTDWTRSGRGGDLPRSELFRRLVPLGEAGVNEVRHESYLVAYCQDVFVKDASGVLEVIVGNPPSEAVTSSLSKEQFHLGFRGEEASAKDVRAT